MNSGASSRKLSIVYGLVFFSGASALIYEVVWQRYLSILLGAQAQATAVVLAFFLGGMGFGYLAFGGLSRRPGLNLLRVYVWIEWAIAIWALLFPYLFQVFFRASPQLYGWLGVKNPAVDLFFSLVLVGIPSFLLGGTLPLLTQALSDEFKNSSLTHSRLYGFNTLGACIGSLFAGYFLIPHFSLSAACWLAGVTNFCVGLGMLAWGRNRPVEDKIETAPTAPVSKALCAVSFLSGCYVLTTQVLVVRWMGLTGGSSHFNFTLVVSVFIGGLALGALWTKGYAKASFATLVWNQLGVSLGLIALYLTLDDWSYVYHVLRVMLASTVPSFYLLQALVLLCLVFVLGIPLLICGASLPLCFHLSKDNAQGLGLRVGQLYFWNTIGCVVGSLGLGFFLLEWLNLDSVFKVGISLALVSLSFAIFLAARAKAFTPNRMRGTYALCLVLLGLVWVCPGVTPQRLLQAFRQQTEMDESFQGPKAFEKRLGKANDLLLWKDGPNTTVGVGSIPKGGPEASRSLFVNGKSDGNTLGDYFTTLALAHLPAILADRIEHVAVIGFGTGITLGAFHLYPEVKSLDVVEISGTVLKHRHLFDEYNGKMSQSSLLKLHEMDAFRFFLASTKRYDVVVSEPSNPWVVGVENLYSEEFYELARSRMTDEGIFVQWIHSYSFSDGLLQTVLGSISKAFPYRALYQLRGGDFAILASGRPWLKNGFTKAQERFSRPIVLKSLKPLEIDEFETLLALELIPNEAMDSLVAGAKSHRLDSPRLSTQAAISFFTRDQANPYRWRRDSSRYLSSLDDSLLARYLSRKPVSEALTRKWRKIFCEYSHTEVKALCEEVAFLERPDRTMATLGAVSSPDELNRLHERFTRFRDIASVIAYASADSFRRPLDGCLQNERSKSSTLWGLCALERLVVAQTYLESEKEQADIGKEYLDWFSRQPKNLPDRAKFAEASEIIRYLPGLSEPSKR